MESDQPKGPDLSQGIDSASLGDGQIVLGHVEGEAVAIARSGGSVFAVGASCTHYGGPLGKGIVVGDTIRCPLHHACFSLRTGEALRAPALDPISCFDVEERGQRLVVTGKAKARPSPASKPSAALSSIVIVGGGAAGHAAAEMLRREGYSGKLTMLSADESPPCDRPNLSKDYLAGTAQEDWIPLRPPSFFGEHDIQLSLGTRVARIDVPGKRVVLEKGDAVPFDALLLSTGASPIKLTVPGSDLSHVHYLRSLADSRSIIASLGGAKRAVVIGASFIGLEVAASLRTRGLEVHVVAPETRPLERIMGVELGDLVRRVHEEHEVHFHLGRTVTAIEPKSATLSSGESLPADIVVAGIGVRPAIELAEEAGLALDRGVSVDQFLQTSAPGIFAAGDIARWPDPHTGERIRVEHWVVAERQGQIAARNMLGQKVPCDLVPFFWSRHFDLGISYVGHAEKWDRIDVDGDVAKRKCRMTFVKGEKTLAVATVGRGRDSLKAEADLEARGSS
jgi:NADPH-dependent 2,4-dienoyl-CoA reductase/sulfur reductase-like enzyme/nitrite reductase/ring-hydroxylating ferredoxin subunit